MSFAHQLPEPSEPRPPDREAELTPIHVRRLRTHARRRNRRRWRPSASRPATWAGAILLVWLGGTVLGAGYSLVAQRHTAPSTPATAKRGQPAPPDKPVIVRIRSLN